VEAEAKGAWEEDFSESQPDPEGSGEVPEDFVAVRVDWKLSAPADGKMLQVHGCRLYAQERAEEATK